MKKLASSVIVAVAGAALFVALPAHAQNLPLAPLPTRGLPVSPFMEGWYANEDGSHTISFGYLNRNNDDVVRIPVGERNLIEPAQFNGNQPTVFLPGRHRGVFTVTVPAGVEPALWWTIVNENGEEHKVPGRVTAHSYELDRNPRPAGSMPPRVALSENGPWGSDPTGITADRPITARVGEPVTLSVWIQDPSQRDPNDPRSEQAKSIRVVWSLHQAPPRGEVEFTRHESTVVPAPPEGEGARPGRRAPPPPGPEEIMLKEAPGVARVYATFTEPGEYVVRGQADNWRSPDSSSGDQCCWSNAYVRVNVVR